MSTISFPAIKYMPLVEESSSSDSSMQSAPDPDNCPICLDNTGRDLITTDCKHTFDVACLAANLKNSQCCPMCSHPFSEEILTRLQSVNSHIIQIVEPQRPLVPNRCRIVAHTITIFCVPLLCALGVILSLVTLALYVPLDCRMHFSQSHCDETETERNKMIFIISSLFGVAIGWLAVYRAWRYPYLRSGG